MTRVKYVCTECGSENIQLDAFASWDVEKQEMVLDDVFEKGAYCGDCDGECSFDVIPIEE